MLLRVDIRETGYKKKPILRDVLFEVAPGEVVGIVGPNGSGKSTLLKAIFGVIRVWDGTVTFRGKEIQNRRPERNVSEGMAFVPQGNRVFDELSVLENLRVGGYRLCDDRLLARRTSEIFELFPELRESKGVTADKLSGGQKQMLALGRALMLRPQLILLDEPSLGLSSRSARAALSRIREVNEEEGTTVLIVEHRVRDLLAMVGKVYGLRLGRLVFSGPPKDLAEDEERQRGIFLV